MRRLLLVCAALLSACGAPEPPAPTGPPRIVSLAPAITEVLVALGARDEIVGVDRFSYEALAPVADARIRSLGSLFTPDLERTVELAPTLVLGLASEQQSAFFAFLRGRGVRVETLSPHTLDEVLASYRTIGAWVGRAAEADALGGRVRRALDALAADGSSTPRPVAVVVEREPLYVVGGGSFVSELVAIAGGRNVFADLDAPYPQVSVELLVERAPLVIVDTTLGGDAHWDALGWKGRVERLPADALTIPGVRLADGARRLRSAIHPEPS